MKFFDCVQNRHFENYFYLDGISDKLGYQRFSQIKIQNKKIQIEESTNTHNNFLRTVITIGKLASLLTVIIPTIMLVAKIIFRLSYSFELPKKALALNERIVVGTYNVLFPQGLDNSGKPKKFSSNIGFSQKSDGTIYENSAFRTSVIAKNILQANLDVICIQEMTDGMANEMIKQLKDYQIAWVKHDKFHGVGILFKKDKFTLLFQDAVKVNALMENNLKPGTYQLASRVHLLQDLQDKTTKKVFRVVSNHMFDPRSLKNKEEQTEKVSIVAEQLAKDYEIDRIIIAGDMNQDQFGDINSPATTPSEKHASSFQPLLRKDFQIDGNYDSTEFEKKLPDNGKILDKGRCIDWIWVKNFKPEHVDLSNIFDNRGSDHALVASIVC